MNKGLLTICLGLFVASGFAQSFTEQTNDTTLFGSASMSDFYGDVDISNNTGSSVQMVWMLDTASLPGGWQFSMCDQSNCHPIGVTQDLWWLPGPGGYLNIHFYPNGNDGEGFVKLHVYDYNNPTDETWITFRGTTLSNGLVENSLEKVKAYPNPCINQTTISGIPIGSYYTITDLLGKEVANGATTTDTQLVDLSNIRSGVYLLSVTSGNMRVSKRLVKH